MGNRSANRAGARTAKIPIGNDGSWGARLHRAQSTLPNLSREKILPRAQSPIAAEQGQTHPNNLSPTRERLGARANPNRCRSKADVPEQPRSANHMPLSSEAIISYSRNVAPAGAACGCFRALSRFRVYQSMFRISRSPITKSRSRFFAGQRVARIPLNIGFPFARSRKSLSPLPIDARFTAPWRHSHKNFASDFLAPYFRLHD